MAQFGNVFTIPISVSASGDTTLVAALTNRNIVVLNYVIDNHVATAQAVTFKAGTTALTGAMDLPSSVGGSIVAHGDREAPVLIADPGQALIINLAAATLVTGHLCYTTAGG